MNPFSNLRDPTYAMLAGMAHGRAHAFLTAARTQRAMGHPKIASDFVKLARQQHHQYLRDLARSRVAP